MAQASEAQTLDFFAGSGEVAGLMKRFNWEATALGPPENWPQSLKTAVRIILTSRFSMWLAWGPELNFFYNDAYRHDTLGLKHPWALGRPLIEVWAEAWSDLGPRVEQVLESEIATWDEGLMLFLERSGFTEETYHTFSYSPLADDQGKQSGLLCVVTEVTERVIGDRRLSFLRELGDQLSNALTEADVVEAVRVSLSKWPKDVPFSLTYLYDADGKAARLVSSTGVGQEASIAPEIIHVDSEDEPWPASEIFHGVRQTVVDRLDQHFQEVPLGPWDRPAREAVVVSIAQQGVERPAGFLVIGVNPYRPLDETYSGFIDLLAAQIAGGFSNARAFEAEKRRAEELAKLDQAKTTFFSNVSHELRTPLTLMLGPLEDLLSKQEQVSSGALAQVEIAHRNSVRLLKLVNTLLDFSRIEAGRTMASFEPVDLSALTAEMASGFGSAFEMAGLSLVVDTPPIGEPVYVDQTMWEKIVLNLMSNALKYTFRGGIEVDLRREGQSAVLEVKDTGIGISPESLERLFERFYRVEGAVGRTHEGTGIGLALVKELVDLHGGEVQVQSEQGVGSVFTVRIPLGSKHLPPEQIQATLDVAPELRFGAAYVGEAQQWLRPSGEMSADASDDLQSERILIADDNADLREYLQRLLEPIYLVETVSNGQEAIDSIRRNPPSLILTDVMMPVLDGFGLLREIRKDEAIREIPVVMLSARAGEESKVDGLESGADDYLVKPFSARELLARVKSNLELANLRKEGAVREERLRVAAELAYDRLKDFAESLPQIVTERDREGHLIWANRRFYEYTGVEVGDLPDDFGQSVVHPQDWDRYLEAKESLAEFGTNLDIEVRLKRHDAVMRWWLVSTTVIRDEAGEVERYYFSATDVQDHKEIEKELESRVEERTAELIKANREMEGFTYSVSHDLRSPLRSIIFNSAVLTEELGESITPEQRELLNRQARSAKKLANLIDDLLKLSRVSRQPLVLTDVDVTELVTELVDQLTNDASRPCEVRIQKGMRALADAQLVQFVFLNLVENACKFSPQGGEVRVGLETIAGEQTFSVVDQGIGFEPVYKDKIFQPFERLVREEEFPGTGIGLANVKRIVERHGGRVWVESTPGKGSSFFFTLKQPLGYLS